MFHEKLKVNTVTFKQASYEIPLEMIVCLVWNRIFIVSLPTKSTQVLTGYHVIGSIFCHIVLLLHWVGIPQPCALNS